MLRLLVVAAVVVAALAQPKPKPCCTPDQWEGRAGSITGTVTGGNSNIVQVNTGISYDFTNKMTAMESQYTVDGMNFDNKTIIRYNDKIMYTIDNIKMLCTAQMIDMEMMQSCVPDNAEGRGPFYYGAGANNMLEAVAFKFEMSTPATGPIMGDIAVTSAGCIPIAEVVYNSNDQTSMMTSVGFVDITPGIKDPSVFDPPSVCSQVKVRQPDFNMKRTRSNFMSMPTH